MGTIKSKYEKILIMMCDVIHVIYMMMIIYQESIWPVEEKKYDEEKGRRFLHMQKDKNYIHGGEEERVKKEKRENIPSVDKENEKEKGGIYTFFVQDKRKGE